METNLNLVKSAALAQRALRDTGIDSIVIGGLAVAIWGEPRLTRDDDPKVLLQRDQAELLVKALPAGFRCLADEPEETLRRVGFLFVQDAAGIRIDFLLAETGFDVEALSRKCAESSAPKKRSIHSRPEPFARDLYEAKRLKAGRDGRTSLSAKRLYLLAACA